MSYTFPRELQPNWISPVAPPVRPVLSQKFQSGADSNLLLSSVPIDGKFACEWWLNAKQIAILKIFWAQVETIESFSLSNNFFSTGCTWELSNEIKSYSPTGLWRFDGIYQTEMLSSDIFKISATFRGALQ